MRQFFLILFSLTIFSAHLQAGCCPQDGGDHWQALKRGNKKFVRNPRFARQRAGLVDGQNPPFLVLNCSDSRVPPELIFDQTLGRLFVGRVAGNVADNVVIDSFEYAATHFDVTTIVVMGHSKCGAVIGALDHLRRNHGKIDPPNPNHHNAVLIPIERAIVAAGIDIYAPNALELSIKANVSYVAKQMLKKSKLISALVAKGKIKIIGSEYYLASGKVHQLFVIDSSNL